MWLVECDRESRFRLLDVRNTGDFFEIRQSNTKTQVVLAIGTTLHGIERQTGIVCIDPDSICRLADEMKAFAARLR